MRVAFLGDASKIERVFGAGRREAVEARAGVLPGVFRPEDLDDRLTELRDVEALFSTWGMPKLSSAQLDQLPNLRAVFYAAGAVSHFARPLIERGVVVSSAWQANAVPVAEFALSQIVLSCKGYFRNAKEFAADPSTWHSAFRGPGAFGETVALLGAGAVATKLIELIQHFKLEVIVFDPSLTKERAEGLGVKAVTLGTAFREGLVVSNHLIDNPATVGLIDAELLGSMRRGATFINTGRGRTVRTQDLVQVLSYRHDLTALLDVTDPEPLPDNSPLRGLANVIVSTHIAGAIGDELLRLADCAIEEFDRLRQGKALRYQVFIHDLI
jgi:phosphoglycerate dehydrogenase-like enzyme